MRKTRSDFKDMTGRRFGRLVAISKAPDRIQPSGDKKTRWNCQCDCGASTVSDSDALRSGRSKSCGCATVESTKARFTKHGNTNGEFRVEWEAYRKMVARCHDPRNNAFCYYGARGIFVSEDWRGSFDVFLADMGRRPDGMTLERKDNNGPYSKGNCIWATRKAQQRNRRCNALLKINGETKTLAEWSEMSGIHRSTIEDRIERGWKPEDAITQPAHQYKRAA